MTVYEASEKYFADQTPLIVLAGKEYGSGSSRDWAAKGTALLGVKAVIAQSYERIHRSNLIGMGVLPLEFMDGQDAASLGLTGMEEFSFPGYTESISPRGQLQVSAAAADGKTITFGAVIRIDSEVELETWMHGGLLPQVLRQFALIK